MVKETNNKMVYGVDCKRLGSLYASALLFNSRARVEVLPALAAHPKYKKLKNDEQGAVRANICTVAKELMILSGLDPEIIENVMEGKS